MTFLKDLRHAVRVLLRTKSWTSVVLVSLALGIGANVGAVHRGQRPAAADDSVPRPGELVRLKWAGDNDMVRSSSDYGFPERTTAGAHVRATVSFAIFQQLRAANQDADRHHGLRADATASTSLSTATRIWRRR